MWAGRVIRSAILTERNKAMYVLTTIFYSGVCGVLAAFVPQGNARAVRAAIGAGVGIAAAAIWPVIHRLLM